MSSVLSLVLNEALLPRLNGGVHRKSNLHPLSAQARILNGVSRLVSGSLEELFLMSILVEYLISLIARVVVVIIVENCVETCTSSP